jgi:hypothetical protein
MNSRAIAIPNRNSSVRSEVCSISLVTHDIAIAIVARQRSGPVGTYGELPELKSLGGNSLVVGLNDRDFVQKPIRPTVFGNVLRAIGVENVAVDPVPIPGSRCR